MLIFKTLAKFLIPAGVGAGIICITMHLTNSAGTLLNSLLPINLKQKPEIPEEEIYPKIEEQQSAEQQSQQQDSSDKESSSSEEPSAPAGADTSEQSTPSTSTTQGSADIETVIKFYAKQISAQGDKWISNSQSLVNIHEVITAITKLTEGVDQLSSKNSSNTK